MNMIKSIFSLIFSTDSFPIFGGTLGALTQVANVSSFFPSWEVLSIALILAFCGSVVGYLAKILVDYIRSLIKDKIIK